MPLHNMQHPERTMSKDLTTTTSVTLRRSVLARLGRHAKEQERSISWLVNHACELWLAENPLPDSEEQEGADDAAGE